MVGFRMAATLPLRFLIPVVESPSVRQLDTHSRIIETVTNVSLGG
jgi:hypothetical protein